MDTFTTATTATLVVEALALTATLTRTGTLLRRLRTDELTGLGNRTALTTAFRRHRSTALVGLLLLDLDGFKTVNDCHGHRTGDRLLQAVAAHLTAACLPGEIPVRLHGDEFAVWLGPTGPRRVTARAEQIAAALTGSLDVDGRWLSASASVGAAVGAPGVGLGELLRQADQAMYAVKRTRHVTLGGVRRAGAA